MSNKEIVKLFKETVALLELQGVNPFKIKAYSSVVFSLDKMNIQSENMSIEAIVSAGISKGMAEKIGNIHTSGSFEYLDDLKKDIPKGVRKMLAIKGIGAKKIRSIWQELEIENLDDLLIACQENKVQTLKGFGQKTEQGIISQIYFIKESANKLHFANAEHLANELIKELKTALGEDLKIAFSGQLRRCMEVVDTIQLAIGTSNFSLVQETLSKITTIEYNEKNSSPFLWRGSFKEEALPPIEILIVAEPHFESTLFLNSASEKHLAYVGKNGQSLKQTAHLFPNFSETEIYRKAEMSYIFPEMREGNTEISLAQENKLPKLIELSDLKGVLHNHSTYSDGRHSLREMATHCKELGYEYLGISDHSQTAFYAFGLKEEEIIKQHQEIDELNKELAPFKVFKGIESDILNDGSLDYSDDVLATFDFIVASIHGNLTMDKQKATNRLIKAIENPFTTILGHPTGRLLLKREGYPIDHKAVIDACATHNVIIEINANPWRLDIDWRWLNYALSQNVTLSINPDAHDKNHYRFMKYGLLVGRKAGLTKQQNFNSLSVEEVTKYFQERACELRIKNE